MRSILSGTLEHIRFSPNRGHALASSSYAIPDAKPLRTFAGIVLALLLLSGNAALSQEARVAAPDRAVPMPKADLPGVFGSGSDDGFRVAQAGDPRVTALEEQIRQLSGTI
ncbi:hypothetical protein AB4144_13340, partial [Rhizobiaceae sp. 2RAB30]